MSAPSDGIPQDIERVQRDVAALVDRLNQLDRQLDGIMALFALGLVVVLVLVGIALVGR